MDRSILQDFGKRVKQIRLARSVSQEELGSLAELDRTYISGIERGLRNVSLVNIARIARALDVTPAALLQFDEVDDV